MRLFLCVLLLGACTSPGADDDDSAPTPNPEPEWEDLSSLLEPILEGEGLPALGAARVAEGSTTHLGTVGLRRADSDVPVTDDDLWHLGSCTKSMTATLVGTFVDEGLLSWESELGELLPDLEGMHEDYSVVSIQMLLSHQGGTWSSVGQHPSTWNMLASSGDVVAQRAQLTEDVLTEAPEVTPGTSLVYSNAGYVIVGSILETISGDSWEALIGERVFEPLGMDSCGFGVPDVDGDLSQPWGHFGLTASNTDNPPGFGPAGTVHCSLWDWSKYAVDQVAGARGEGGLLSDTQFAQMFADQGFGYAMGWILYDDPHFGGTALMHAGTNTMNYAEVWLVPELDGAYLAATNSHSDSSTSIIQGVLLDLMEFE
jgi:CubicO group peptidase (beta-lactamase class C family)